QMTSLDNIVLKEHLKRSLPGKSDKLRCFERVLTDEASGGKSSPEEAYFLLVGESIYFSDVKCSTMRLAVSLRRVADIAIVKTPRLGLAEEYRVQTLLITCRPGGAADDSEEDDYDDDVVGLENGEDVAAKKAAVNRGSESGTLTSGELPDGPSAAAENGDDKTDGGGGCFGRKRRQAAAAEATSPTEPPPPAAPAEPQADPAAPAGQQQQRPGGCLPRRRKNVPPAAEDPSATSSTPQSQQLQQSQQPELTPLVNGDSNPRPSGVPTSAVDGSSTAVAATRSFRILCNVFSSSRSVAFLHLRNTWQMATLLGTLDMDDEFVDSTTPRTPNGRERRGRGRTKRPPASLSSAHLTQLFRELRTDILRTQGNMQEAFGFLFELKLSLDRGYPVKKLFWETDDLFRCVVNKLFYFLNKDPALLQGRVSSPAAIRLDELDYCLLSLQILSAVFLDTEFLVERRKATAAQQHYFMQRMLRACAVQIRPCVPNFVFDPAKTRPDHRITGQLHVERAALLHHIITYLRGSSAGGGGGLPLIGRSDGSIVSENQVVELLASEADGLLIMLTESVRLLSHLFDKAQPAENSANGAAESTEDDDNDGAAGSETRGLLRPLEVVQAYYLLFTINSVLTYCNQAREHLIRQHREDFRFFISEHRIRAAVRPDLPIFPGLLELAKQVRAHLGVL
ncbi:hypothetical protein BOX15_Mlig004948g1, partial [Macrostomum lignano]